MIRTYVVWVFVLRNCYQYPLFSGDDEPPNLYLLHANAHTREDWESLVNLKTDTRANSEERLHDY